MNKKYIQWCISGIFLGIIGSPVLAETTKTGETVRFRLPVWTEELGEVNLDDYTHEELDAMTRAYWTPERMRNAKPADMPVLPPLRGTLDYAVGDWMWPQQEEPYFQAAEPVPPTVDHGIFRRKSGSLAAINSITNGKVYFKDFLTGADLHCSGSAVNSPSKRLVATAAHCIYTGATGNRYLQSNIRFVPAAYYDQEPHGSFGGFGAYMPSDWVEHGGADENGENISGKGLKSDVAFLVTYSNQLQKKVVEWVGGHGIGFGGGLSWDMIIFGYPDNLNDGEISKACTGLTGNRWFGGYNFLSLSGCNFGGGASGGPWITWYDFSTGLGTMRSVSSWGAKEDENYFPHINGPRFTGNIHTLYTDADNGWADWGGQE